MRKKAGNHQLIEATLKTITADRVDREAGIIYGVRMAGLSSKNKRDYIPEAYKQAIKAGHYEGKPCNIDHVKEGEQTKVASRFGVWHDAEYREKPEPGVYGNLHYIKSHSLANNVCEAAERKELNSAFGMSHDAYAGNCRPGVNGRVIVESIESVKSIDLVADPATTKGLFEHKEPTPMKQTILQLIESACTFGFQKKEIAKLQQDTVIANRLTEEVEHEDGKTAVELATLALDELAVHLVRESEDCTKQISAVKQAKKRILEGEDDEVIDPIVEESKTISIDKAFQLCEQLELKPTSKQLKALLKLDEATAKDVAEEFARVDAKEPTKKTISAPRLPVKESVDNETKPVANSDELRGKCFS